VKTTSRSALGCGHLNNVCKNRPERRGCTIKALVATIPISTVREEKAADIPFRACTLSACGFGRRHLPDGPWEGVVHHFKRTTLAIFMAFIYMPSDRIADDVYAPCLAGLPVDVCYAEWIQGGGYGLTGVGRAVEADAVSPDRR
jgi:hypothetical protein